MYLPHGSEEGCTDPPAASARLRRCCSIMGCSWFRRISVLEHGLTTGAPVEPPAFPRVADESLVFFEAPGMEGIVLMPPRLRGFFA